MQSFWKTWYKKVEAILWLFHATFVLTQNDFISSFWLFFKHDLIKLSACLCFLKMSNFGPQFERKHARQISTVDKSEELILHTFNDFLNVAYYMSNKNQGPKILK